MEISVSLDPAIPDNLERYLKEVNKLESISIHIDVMDGKFVERVSVSSIEYFYILRTAAHPIDVHLMAENPNKKVDTYISDIIRSLTFHAEAVTTEDGIKLLEYTKSKGIQAGIAIDLETDVSKVTELIKVSDLVLVMSVKAGKSGQELHTDAFLKVAKIKSIKPGIRVIMDGGINADNAPIVKLSGTDVAAVGSAMFNAANRSKMLKRLRS